MSRYDLTDFGWGVIQPLLPNKQRGVPSVATRYDKLAANFLAMVQLASVRLWLRAYEYYGLGVWSRSVGESIMLGIISAAGNALRAFGSVHPAIKWGVVILAGLLAVEFVGKEAISLCVAMQTAPAQIEKIRGEGAQGQGLAFNSDKAVADRQTPAEKLVALRLACQAPSSAEYRRLLNKEGSDYDVSHLAESCAKLFPANWV